MNLPVVIASLNFTPLIKVPAAAFLALVILPALIIASLGFKDNWRSFGAEPWVRAINVALSFTALALLGLAAGNLCWKKAMVGNGVHLVVVVDTSDSVIRDVDAWARQLQDLKRIVTDSVAALGPDRTARSHASLVTLGEKAYRQRTSFPLSELNDEIGRISTRGSGRNGTDIEAALDEAGKVIRSGSDAATVLMVTDGNETRGNGLKAAGRLAEQGVPVCVLPIQGPGPALWITDAFLSRRVQAGENINVRAIFRNGSHGELPAHADFSAEESNQRRNASNAPLASQLNQIIPANTSASSRWKIPFSERGLQYVDVSLQTKGHDPHHRRLFTYVEASPRILSVGGDRRWEEALDPNIWEVTATDPTQFATKLRENNWDAIVIGALTATQLGKDNMDLLAQDVTNRGAGLFIWNGDHGGLSPETPTVLMTYRATPLEKLIPVLVDPRGFVPPPPPQQVVIVLDCSGSMADDNKIGEAQALCAHIVNQMRSEDTLDFLTFADGYNQLVANSPMTKANKLTAIAEINRVTAGGGTEPKHVLDFLKTRTLTRAALFFITDGFFDPNELHGLSRFASTNPIAMLTKQDFARLGPPPPGRMLPDVERSNPLWQLGVPLAIAPGFNVERLKFKFFEPEERKKFFESGTFDPIRYPMEIGTPKELSIPSLSLPGNAICYRKPDSILVGVRPKFVDPILAFGDAGPGKVGVFTTGLPVEWRTDPVARTAVNGWIKYLVPFSEKDRYDFAVEDAGSELDIRVSILAKNGHVPVVGGLSGIIETAGHQLGSITFTPDPENAATFHGRWQLSQGNHAQAGSLILTETGVDKTSRPQRIPIMLPPLEAAHAAASEELWTQGINTQLLQKITEVSGGQILGQSPVVLFSSAAAPSQIQFWRGFTAAAALFYLSAIALRRWNS